MVESGGTFTVRCRRWPNGSRRQTEGSHKLRLGGARGRLRLNRFLFFSTCSVRIEGSYSRRRSFATKILINHFHLHSIGSACFSFHLHTQPLLLSPFIHPDQINQQWRISNHFSRDLGQQPEYNNSNIHRCAVAAISPFCALPIHLSSTLPHSRVPPMHIFHFLP